VDYPRYDPQSAVTPLTGDELTALDRLLQGLPADAAMTLDGLDGYLTALQVGPPELLATLPTAQWLPLVWGGDSGPGEAWPFASRRQRKALVVTLLRHLRHLGEQFTSAPEAWEPIFSVAEQGPDEWVDARDWCAGFLQAVDLQPAAWRGRLDDPTLGPALAPLVLLGGGLDEPPPAATELADVDLDDLAACDRLSRTVPDAVLLLRSRRSGAEPAGSLSPEARPGR
jgi:uncharacterized protein